MAYDKIVVASGHMIDLPGRPEARFPPRREAVVRGALAATLERWEIGAKETAAQAQ